MVICVKGPDFRLFFLVILVHLLLWFLLEKLVVLYSDAIRSLSDPFYMLAGCKRHEGGKWNKKVVFLRIGSSHRVRSTKQAPVMKATLVNDEHSRRKKVMSLGTTRTVAAQQAGRYCWCNRRRHHHCSQHDRSSHWPLLFPGLTSHLGCPAPAWQHLDLVNSANNNHKIGPKSPRHLGNVRFLNFSRSHTLYRQR